MPRGFDKEDLGKGLLLSLPMREGTGTVLTQDIARPHHPVLMTHAPVWTQLSSGIWVLDFDGASDYLTCAGASCTDLNFIAGDFSIAVWVYGDDGTGYYGSANSLMGRYVLNASGWETFLFDDHLTLRTSQAADSVSCYADGYRSLRWQLIGISRSGVYPLMYCNGLGLEMHYEAGGIVDPVTSAADLVIGAATGHLTYFDGKLWNPRIWSRNLSAAEHMAIFNSERHLFGV